MQAGKRDTAKSTKEADLDAEGPSLPSLSVGAGNTPVRPQLSLARNKEVSEISQQS